MSLAFYNTVPAAGWAVDAVICGHPCELFSAGATDKSGAGFWLWLCDSPVRATNVKPFAVAFVPGDGTLTLDYRVIDRAAHRGRKLRGLYILASSDPLTLTPIGADDAFFMCNYETRH